MDRAIDLRQIKAHPRGLEPEAVSRKVLAPLSGDLDIDADDIDEATVSALEEAVRQEVGAAAARAVRQGIEDGLNPRDVVDAVTRQSLAAVKGKSADSYWSTLTKLIPAESVTAYLTLVGLLETAPEGDVVGAWIVFGILVAITPVYVAFQLRSSTNKRAGAVGLQVTLTTLVFVTWAYTIGGPFSKYDWYDVYWGSLAILLLSFIAPLLLFMAAPKPGAKPRHRLLRRLKA